ncbi:MAG: 50S ribosomal protein L11 methyltransferase [Thermodesulfobacteriota bacterium]
MLHSPYTQYKHLYVYHLDMMNIPAVDDPDLIGVWIEDNTAVLFFHKNKDALVAKICHENGCEVIYQADLDYEDWEAGHQISAFEAGSFTVAPIWEKTDADIVLDPSVIFGSGFHPTTRTCLQLVDKYAKTPELTINSMLDLGTGTGLLSIAAAKHGVKEITAIDNNPLACQVAQANCRYNHVEKHVSVQEADLRNNPPQTKEVDLVVANLYRGLLEELFNRADFWQGNLYILSGFIKSMEADLLAAIPADKLRFLERTRKEQWCIWVIAPKDSLFLQS